MDFKTALESIRVNALDTQPFWAVIALKLELLICSQHKGQPVPTAATDGKNLYVNEEYGRSLSKSMLNSLILHEVAHVALGHQFRRGKRDHFLFNIACDYVINLLLRDAGYEIPSTWYCDSKFRGWSEERVYAHIVREKEEEPIERVPVDDENSDEQGEEKGEEKGEEQGEEKGEEKGEEQGEEKGDGPGKSPEPLPPGEVWDATDEDGNELTEAEKEEGLRELSEDIQQAQRAAHDAGKSNSADLRRATDRLTNPKLPWHKFLARWINKKGKPIGRSWGRLDRRPLTYRHYVPAEVREGMDWLVVAVDISYSAVWAFDAFVSHLEKIRKTAQIQRITVVPFNHVIQRDGIVNLKPRDKFPKEMGTGGGTRFAPIFHWLRRQKGRPDAVIVFTDLECSDYGEAPRVPVLWASTAEGNTPFGETVLIDTE